MCRRDHGPSAGFGDHAICDRAEALHRTSDRESCDERKARWRQSPPNGGWDEMAKKHLLVIGRLAALHRIPRDACRAHAWRSVGSTAQARSKTTSDCSRRNRRGRPAVDACGVLRGDRRVEHSACCLQWNEGRPRDEACDDGRSSCAAHAVRHSMAPRGTKTRPRERRLTGARGVGAGGVSCRRWFVTLAQRRRRLPTRPAAPRSASAPGAGTTERV